MDRYATEMYLPFYQNTGPEKIYSGKLYNEKFYKNSNPVPTPVTAESVIKAFRGEIVSDISFVITGSIY